MRLGHEAWACMRGQGMRLGYEAWACMRGQGMRLGYESPGYEAWV